MAGRTMVVLLTGMDWEPSPVAGPTTKHKGEPRRRTTLASKQGGIVGLALVNGLQRRRFDSDESARPRISEVSTYAAKTAQKPSKEPKEPLRVTRAQAHEIWAHASLEAIKKLPQAVTRLELKEGDTAKQWRQCETCI